MDSTRLLYFLLILESSLMLISSASMDLTSFMKLLKIAIMSLSRFSLNMELFLMLVL